MSKKPRRVTAEQIDRCAPHDGGGGATEDLKARDPMQWVGLTNTLKVQMEEIILDEFIFC